MPRSVRLFKTGGPEVIEWVETDLIPPGPGEVRFRSTAVGLNYIDVYHREGLYPVSLPTGLGAESAGVVDAVGDGVDGFVAGDRVATFGPALGAYATHRTMPAPALFKLPGGIEDAVAAAVLLKGCTAEFLIERCARVQPGMTVLVHAAAGGVGLLLVQWLKHIGATVIGTVSTDDKAKAAIEAGADHVIRYKTQPIAAAARELTEGRGVDVVFDGIGMATWEASLDATRPRGLIISYGNADKPVTGVALGSLGTKGSLFVTRPTLFNYYVTPEERATGSARLFDLIAKDAIKVTIGQTYALEHVAQAHRDLESGRTKGSTVLVP